MYTCNRSRAELLLQRPGDVAQQRQRELRRVQRVVGAARTPRCRGSPAPSRPGSWRPGTPGAAWSARVRSSVGGTAVGGTARRRGLRAPDDHHDDHDDQRHHDGHGRSGDQARGCGGAATGSRGSAGHRSPASRVVRWRCECTGPWRRWPASPVAAIGVAVASAMRRDVAAHQREHEVPHGLIALTGRTRLTDVGADRQGHQVGGRVHTRRGQRIEVAPLLAV